MPGPSTSPKTVFLHVGCRKSGTSGLQLGLKRAVEELRAVGLEQPLGARGGIMGGLVDPLRDALESGDDAAARTAIEKVAARIAASPYPRHLISLEALAELPAEATRLVVEGLAGVDLRLVVTVRPWVFTIPSEWQQLVKSRFTVDYRTFADGLRDPDVHPAMAVEAERFRRRQDVADVVRRWRAADPDLPASVVMVPPDRNADPDLTALFCRVLDIDPALLPIPDRVVNPSITHDNAEVLRLVNIALGDRLPDTRRSYRHSVRKWIAVGTMMKGSSGAKIRLPLDLEPWASQEAARQVAELAELGAEVLGDAESFVHPPLPPDDFVPASDAEVARAAATVIAELAQGHHRERRRDARRHQRRRAVARQKADRPRPVAPPPSGPQRVLRAVRRRAGVVARRIGTSVRR